MDDGKKLGGGGRLQEFKQSIAQRAAAFEEFRQNLLRIKGKPGTTKQRKTPLHMRKAKRRRQNKAARLARRHNRRR